MLLGLWAFVKSPIGRYGLAAVALAGAFMGFRLHFLHQGQLEGKQAATEQFTAQEEKQKTADRAETDAHLARDEKMFQAFTDRLDAAGKREDAAAAAIAALVNQRGRAAAQVDGLKDTELHDFIAATIGLRNKLDRTPGYSPGEERVIAHAVVDDPLCRKQAESFPEQLQACADAKVNLAGQRDTKAQELVTLAEYTGRLEAYYVQAYNAIPRKGHPLIRLLTFGIKGKARKINAPDPVLVKQERGKHDP